MDIQWNHQAMEMKMKEKDLYTMSSMPRLITGRPSMLSRVAKNMLHSW